MKKLFTLWLGLPLALIWGCQEKNNDTGQSDDNSSDLPNGDGGSDGGSDGGFDGPGPGGDDGGSDDSGSGDGGSGDGSDGDGGSGDGGSDGGEYGPENSWYHVMESVLPGDLVGTGRHKGDIANNFTLKDQFGQDVELYQFYGQVIVIDAFAEW